jgi:hypothetical protein
MYGNTIYYKEEDVKKAVDLLNKTNTGKYDWVVYN